MQVRLRSLLPHGWRDLARQLLLFGGAYFLYNLVRGAATGRGMTATAFRHASELINVERTLHLFVEPSMQAWASGSHLLMALSTWLYLNAQTTVLAVILLYLYLRHNDSFYFVRNMLVVGMVIALIGYVLFPTAPPRFLPEWGFFDTISNIAHIPANSVPENAFFNPYAAIPSMHVACALMVGWPLARLVRTRAARVFWFLYPFLITFVTVITANHFIADALLGALTAGISAVVAVRLARMRPHAWRFAPTPVPAA